MVKKLTSFKVAELRAKLSKLGLDTSGKKAELVARLEAAQASSSTSSSASTSSKNYSKMKVAELRAELKAAGLDTKGKKAELVARLEAGGVGGGAGGSGVGKKRKRGAGGNDDDDDDDDDEVVAQSSAKGKKGGKKGKGGAKAKGGKGGAKAKTKSPAKKQKNASTAAAAKKKSPKVDSLAVPKVGSGAVVVDEWDALLNQTNIAQNNNKYYILQVISSGGRYSFWTRWGRVGEPGQNKLASMGSLDAAIKAFKKKFKDKTKNNWDDRANFVPKSGKYTLMEMADDDEDEDEAVTMAALDAVAGASASSSAKVKYEDSALPPSVQKAVSLMFSSDMFKSAMAEFKIDTKKMPLGKIAVSQIERARDVLSEIKDAQDAGQRRQVVDLSSKFYTLIPHSFGRSVPPPLATAEAVQTKMQMLDVLADIEKAQKMLSKGVSVVDNPAEPTLLPNPLDEKYATLKTDLTPVAKNSEEFKIIQKYTTNTMRRKVKIMDVFAVERHSAADRHSPYEDLHNRKLLWHGTNVAVVAAILKSGLRIMPSAGGRVGAGLYHASEHGKSASYVRTTPDRIGFMFLTEVALGDEGEITVDDWSIRGPPSGCHSIVARGRHEPDPKADITMDFDGNEVVVPLGKPKDRKKYANSRFSDSEYLVYDERQSRIRFLIKYKF